MATMIEVTRRIGPAMSAHGGDDLRAKGEATVHVDTAEDFIEAEVACHG